MPSVRYYNSSAPFWDFIANLETQGASHPFFARSGPPQEGPSSDEEGFTAGPWGWGHRRWHQGPPPPPPGAFPHHFHHGRRGPPPPAPPPGEGENLPAYEQSPDTLMADEKNGGADPETSVPQEKGKAKEGNEGACDDQERCRGAPFHRGRCGGRGGRGGRFGARGGPWWAGQRGGRGGFPGPWGAVLADLFGEGAGAQGDDADYKPDVDVFDAEDRFIIHVSLPGAKKEDVGVNWDAEKSEISIAGVTYRPADEEVLKTLAMDERKVGPFERKVRLGSRANPAQVDAEAISAKLEDGILIIEVPKLDKDYVEVKKVDIE